MDTNKASYDAGKVHGKAEEKGSTLMDKAGGAAQTAKDSVLGVGSQVQAGALGAVDAVKNATGMKK